MLGKFSEVLPSPNSLYIAPSGAFFASKEKKNNPLCGL